MIRMHAALRFARRHLLGVLIVLFWLAMMGRLVQKHSMGSSIASLVAGTPLSVNVYDDWLGIYYEGEKVGYAHRTFGPEGEDYRFEEQSFLEVTAMGFPLTVSVKIRGITRPDLGLKSFTFDLQSGLVETSITGRVEGSVLELDLVTAGMKSTQSIDLDTIPTLPMSLSALLREKSLEKGQTFSLPVLDPATLSLREMVVEVKGEEFLEIHGKVFPVYHLTTGFAGIDVDLWVDAGGRVLKENTPLGWELIRESRADALTQGWKSGVRIDMVRATSVTAEGEPIPEPQVVRFLGVELPLASMEGLDIEGFDLVGGRQEVRHGRLPILYVTKEDLTGLEPVELPVEQEGMAPYLTDDLFVQSAHPEIVEQARRIASGERDALRVAERLLRWVHDNLEKRAVPSLPNALEVLHTKVGDCNEHTVLYVALARALGLPARTNVGLVMVDDRFYYHAWPEVYAGEWIAVDPVFGQIPADATHIRFIRGGLDKQVEIVRIIGRLETLRITAVE